MSGKTMARVRDPNPIVSGPDQWGPAMRLLDDRRQRFVVALFAGTGSAKAAALAAGFHNGPGLKVTAHRLLHEPRVQAALIETGRGVLAGLGPKMLSTLVKLALTAPNLETRRKAASNLLDRAGLAAAITINERHDVVISFDEKLLEIRRLAALCGDDPDRAVAGLVPPTIEHENAGDAESGRSDRWRKPASEADTK